MGRLKKNMLGLVLVAQEADPKQETRGSNLTIRTFKKSIIWKAKIVKWEKRSGKFKKIMKIIL